MRIKIGDEYQEIDVFFEKEETKGRPRKVLTEDALKLIEKLSQVLCTDEEIAAILGTQTETLKNETNGEVFREAVKKGRESGKASLRRKQFEMAMKGNSSLLIWLGKQWLGQTDKISTTVNTEDESKKLMAEFLESIRNGESKEN